MTYHHTTPREQAGQAASHMNRNEDRAVGAVAHALVHIGDQFGRVADQFGRMADQLGRFADMIEADEQRRAADHARWLAEEAERRDG